MNSKERSGQSMEGQLKRGPRKTRNLRAATPHLEIMTYQPQYKHSSAPLRYYSDTIY